jgi:hypothetical protein
MTPFPTPDPNRARGKRRTIGECLRIVALELVEAARALVEEIDEFQSPPSRRQIDAVQDRMNGLQRLLNRVQTATDTWSVETEDV